MKENKKASGQPWRLYFLLFLLVVVAGSFAFLFLFDFKKYNSKKIPQKLLGEDYSQFVLALDLDGNGLDVSKIGMGLGASHVYFDLDNDDFSERTAWIVGNDGLLAIDQNGNGQIDNQNELFGNNKTHSDGFRKLYDLDPNKDGVIYRYDQLYEKLLVWVDSKQDGISAKEELHTLSDLGISEIRYDDPEVVNVHQNENYIGLSSTFIRNRKELQIKSIWLRNSPAETVYRKQVNLDVRTMFLPTLKGFGELRDLHIAMSEDEALLKMVQSFFVSWNIEKFQDHKNLDEQIKNIMFRWAGVDDVKDQSRGQFVNAKEIEFMERVTGRGYKGGLGGRFNQPISEDQGKRVHDSFVVIFGNMKAFILAQVIVPPELFDPPLRYNIARGDINTAYLTQNGVDHFVKVATTLPDFKRSDFWIGVADFLLFVKPKARFTDLETEMLDRAISSTLIGSSWEKIAEKADKNHLGKLTSSGSPGDDLLVTSEGNDDIYGNDGNDLLTGMTGNDALSGGTGNDIYKFYAGDGNDVIQEISGESDVILFEGNDITSSSIKVEKQGSDLIIHYTRKDTIKILNYFTDEGSKVEFIEFLNRSKQKLSSFLSE
jgi:hypothetical protein